MERVHSNQYNKFKGVMDTLKRDDVKILYESGRGNDSIEKSLESEIARINIGIAPKKSPQSIEDVKNFENLIIKEIRSKEIPVTENLTHYRISQNKVYHIDFGTQYLNVKVGEITNEYYDNEFLTFAAQNVQKVVMGPINVNIGIHIFPSQKVYKAKIEGELQASENFHMWLSAAEIKKYLPGFLKDKEWLSE